MKIKKGQRFMCVKDYVMENGQIDYSEGKEYYSETDGCLTDNEDFVEHKMSNNNKFKKHFEEIIL